MKKTLLFLIMLFVSLGYISAQNNDADIISIQKQITKSNADIQNPKKSEKSSTWVKRANIFMTAYNINSKYLVQGLPSNAIALQGFSEASTTPYYGKPTETKKEGDFNVMYYPKVKIYCSNGIVDHWVDLAPVDTNSVDIAYQALNKAIELDQSGKFVEKSSTVKLIAQIRELVLNKAIEKYNANDNKAALNNIEKGILLLKYPRASADTLVKTGAYYYYAGIFAFGAEEFNKSKEYFQKAISENYEIGTSYQYLAESMYKLNDSTNAVKLLEEGADKYPQETKIIYSLIDYYTPKGEYDIAFKYIDKAIELTPKNSILYIVKGSSYQKIYENIQNKYFDLLTIADSLDKEAFKYRNDPKKSSEYTTQENDIINNKIPKLEKDMANYKQKCLDAYELGISIDPKGDYYYTVGYFYYKNSVLTLNQSTNLRKLKTITAKLDDDAKKSLLEAKKYSEKSLELNPTDTYTLDLLSKIYYRLGMYDESTNMKKRLTEIKSKN